MRSAAASTDTASSESVLEDFVSSNKDEFDVICMIQPTSPLTHPTDFANAIAKLQEEKADSLVTVVRTHRFHWNEAGEALDYNPAKRPRRQDWQGQLVENGAFYLTRAATLKDTGSRLGGKIAHYEMPEHTYQEIDSQVDLEIMQKLAPKYGYFGAKIAPFEPNEFQIAPGVSVGGTNKCFVIGEAGINHQGDVEIAKKLIKMAKDVGCDAVKFQKRTVERILSKEGLMKPYVNKNSFGPTYGEHKHALELGEPEWNEMKKYADEVGILFFASGWDEDSVDFLDRVGCPFYKVASADLTNFPLLEHTARKGKPLILSTGMAEMETVRTALKLVTRFVDKIVLLQCTSTYPTKVSETNLRVLRTYQKEFPQCVIGYSGHEKGLQISLAAVAMGAKVVERHITLDRTMKGGDHAASLEPKGIETLIRDIAVVEEALGSCEKKRMESEAPVFTKLAKSVVSAVAIPKGTTITREMITTKGPGSGISPMYMDLVVGSTATEDIPEDVVMKPEVVSATFPEAITESPVNSQALTIKPDMVPFCDKAFDIAPGVSVGGTNKCFVIGEAGINHQGDVEIAKKLIKMAKDVGCDAVKFQKRTVERILSKEGLMKPYVNKNSFGPTYGEHKHALELGEPEWNEMKKYADEVGILFFASGWDEDSVDFLDRVGCPFYKVASADLTNFPLLEHTARKGKPLILSTGMAEMETVRTALKLVTRFVDKIVLLQCTSTYPTKVSETNLRVLRTYQKEFPQCVIGYSGHEKGLQISLAAVAMGAKVVERHITLDRTMKGGDHAASLEPKGIETLIRDIAVVEEALGSCEKKRMESEAPVFTKLAKSVVSAVAIPKGTTITREMITTKGPGSGISPMYMDLVVGSTATEDIPEDVVMMAAMVDAKL